MNLLSNAIRYNDKDRGEVSVKLSEDEDFYVLSVCDNGVGIAEEHHDQIFDTNFTLNRSDRFDNMGTGIGLSTVKDLVSALNGTIKVSSTLGSGSTFLIRLKK